MSALDLLCYREKDKEIGSLRSELAAARHRIHVDERASRVPSNIDTAGMTLQAQSQVERLEAANAKLEVRFESLYRLLHCKVLCCAFLSSCMLFASHMTATYKLLACH